MKAVDSSVVIAAFASWHEHHAIARKAMAARPRLIAQAAVESYSVLTRLPPPHRASPSIVHSFTAEHNATLLSLDQRAATTYEIIGARVEQLLG